MDPLGTVQLMVTFTVRIFTNCNNLRKAVSRSVT